MAVMWLTPKEYAEIRGVTARAVRKELQKRHANGDPSVRTVQGRGGKSGFIYEVQSDSFQPSFDVALTGLKSPVSKPLKHDEKACAERQFRHVLLTPALEHPRGSRARGRAIAAIAAVPHRLPNGRVCKLSRETINRWLRLYEEQGFAGITRKERVDANSAKVVIGKRFDAWWPGDRLALLRLGSDLKGFIRGLHKNLESEDYMRLKGELYLRGLLAEMVSAEVLPQLPPDPAILEIPYQFIRTERQFRHYGTFKKDRKAYEDNMRPRIRRTIAGMQPMDVVFGDVHPLDFYLGERGELQSYARSICWMDAATHRVWMDVVVLPKGESVRNEHVIASFIRMCLSWGLPKHLYIDNGSEYNFAEFLDDAMKLASRCEFNAAERRRSITNSTPYNGPGKGPIEGFFGTFRHAQRPLPGYVGGDRMKAKVSTIGRKPDAFEGSLDDFGKMIADALSLYHIKPKRGQLHGRSPSVVYNSFIEAGWLKTDIEEDAFAAVFSTEQVKQLRQGVIRHDGFLWTCQELQRHIDGQVVVLCPKYTNWHRLPVKDLDGRLIGFAERDAQAALLDQTGAKESSRRASAHRKSMRALGKSAPELNAAGILQSSAATIQPVQNVGAGALITASDEQRALAKGLKESPKARRDREREESERETLQQLEIGKSLSFKRTA